MIYDGVIAYSRVVKNSDQYLFILFVKVAMPLHQNVSLLWGKVTSGIVINIIIVLLCRVPVERSCRLPV